MFAGLKQWWRAAGADRPYIAAGAVAFLIAVSVVWFMADEAVPGRFLATEGAILRAFRHPDNPALGWGPPWVTPVVRDITALGGFPVLLLLELLVLGFLVLIRRYRAALLIVFATGTGALVTQVIKAVAERPRPQIVPHLMEVTSLSFPSGHSMMSSVVYLTLGVLLGQTVARKREKIYLICAALLVTILVGLSRIYLGVHYPTDVLAGWCAGIAWALLFWLIAWELQRRGNLRRPEE